MAPQRTDPRSGRAPEPDPRRWATIADLVDVVEMDDATAARAVGPLFRRLFGDDLPGFPRHFVLRYVGEGAPVPLAYAHFTPWEHCYLGGGMAFDERAYRRLPASHRTRIRAAGGVTEFLLRRIRSMLDDAIALFGHVGEPRAERVDLRAGYERTGYPHLIVCWQRAIPALEREALLGRAAAQGPF
ncbi:MAG: hypothetical protein ABI585_04505 [Betaproteobacteria bacterium]